MENSERTGECNSRNQHLGDETELLRTIDEIQDSNNADESHKRFKLVFRILRESS